jgi:outer membrane protein TolC
MNRKIIAIGIISLGLAFSGRSQKTLTLDEALKGAEKNYPGAKQKESVRAVGEQQERLLNNALYPQVNVTGQAAFQSEVTAFAMPGSAEEIGQKPDNYSIGLEMRLPLTQFGTVQTRKQIEKAQTSLSISQLDADVQKVRERVTTIFGNVLLQKENQSILMIRLGDLQQQRKKVAVGVASGAVLKSNQLVFDSEILTTEQRVGDVRATLTGLIQQLSLLTGMKLDTSMQFQLTDIKVAAGDNINRPELQALETQKQLLDLQSELLVKETRPNLYVFGQGFYGRPGYNFLNTNLRPYAIGGIGLSWNINNMLNHSKQQKLIGLNKDIVDHQEETFRLNLETSLIQQRAEIDKYQTIIGKDAQIVNTRQEILRAAASQLENGVITSTEYMIELNQENTAELNLALHQVQLSMAKAQYNTILGY